MARFGFTGRPITQPNVRPTCSDWAGPDLGVCDIYGKDWPPEIDVAGTSRDGDWPSEKMKILANYKISIAVENTLIPYYITEKLWDAIRGATLPVYQGGNNIYEVLPRDSFVDANGKTPEQLADEIQSMQASEMEARYERCLRSYLAIPANAYRESRDAVNLDTIRLMTDIARR